MSNSVCTTRFWNKYAQYRNTGKPKNLKVFRSNKPKDLNRIAKIGYGYLCLREIYLHLINYIMLPKNKQ